MQPAGYFARYISISQHSAKNLITIAIWLRRASDSAASGDEIRLEHSGTLDFIQALSIKTDMTNY